MTILKWIYLDAGKLSMISAFTEMKHRLIPVYFPINELSITSTMDV